MSDLVNVTFIGGTADLSRRVLDWRDVGPIINVPVLPTPEPLRYGENPALPAERVVCRVETYVVQRISQSQAIAVLQECLR